MRVGAVGVCGSDLHSYTEGAVGELPCQYPMVLGHEPAGTVVAAGAGVTGWAPGDRAALEPAVYCYHCDYCRSGRYNICANIRFLSNPGIPGFFREFVNLPPGNLLPFRRALAGAGRDGGAAGGGAAFAPICGGSGLGRRWRCSAPGPSACSPSPA